MGSRSILATQYVAPLFLEHFDDSCHKFHRRKSNYAHSITKDKDTKKQLQRRTAIALEVENFLRNSRTLEMKWIFKNTARLILSTGIVILVFVDENNEGQELSFAVHRIPGFDGISPPHLVVWENDKGVVLTTDGRILLFRCDLLLSPESEMDLQCQIETFPSFLPPFNSKRVERRMVLSDTSNEFAIWWPSSGDEVFPWNPKPEQKANILVYSLVKLDEDRPSLIFYTRTEGNLLSVHFVPYRNEIIIVEDSCGVGAGGITALRETKYDLSSQLRVSEVVIPLQSQLKCHAYDRKKEKLCLGLCNSSIVISFHDGKITRFTKTSFMPCQLAWHTNGFVVLALGSRGQVQMFDIALNPLFFRSSDDRRVPTLILQLEPHEPFCQVIWGCSEINNNSLVLLGSESGNISVLDLQTGSMTLTSLISRHLDSHPCSYAEAIKVLNGVPWDTDLCATAHHLIFTRLRAEEYSETIQGYFEDLLELYFNPSIEPLDSVWTKHKDKMNGRALSYHHWLFLSGRFKRSLEVAAMVKDENCIRKVFYSAHSSGAVDVATEAKTILNDMQNIKKIGPGALSGADFSASSRNSSCSTCDSSEESEEKLHVASPVPGTTESQMSVSRDPNAEAKTEASHRSSSPTLHPQKNWEQFAISENFNNSGPIDNPAITTGNGVTVVRLGDV